MRNVAVENATKLHTKCVGQGKITQQKLEATSERECERDSVVGVRASKEAGPTDRATDRCYIATAVALGILVQALCMHYVFVYNVRYI